MHALSIHDSQSIAQACAVLRAGGVIVYPTDTAYGLGVDATNPHAVEKLFAIKGRDAHKPIPIIVSTIAESKAYVSLSLLAEHIAEAHWPGPLTLVLPALDPELAELLHSTTTIAIRVPSSDWCRALVHEFGKPITSTSANASGTPTEYTLEGAQKSLHNTQTLIDLWLDGGMLPKQAPSTIIRIENNHATIERHGAIPAEELQSLIQTI